MKRIEVNGRRIYVAAFRSLAAARRWGGNWVVMGDAPEFWAVRPVDFVRLLTAGYEAAR